MPRIATASSSDLAAAAAVRIAEEGGNAVDGAVASALVSMITEPGVCALGGGGFVTIWIPGADPVTIDGYIEMPGRGLPRDRFGKGAFDVTMAYGGGITTTIGHGSVGTPGALAALGLASARYGRIPWPLLVEPAYELARDGFPLSQPSTNYLRFSHEVVFGWQEPSRAALHREDGSLIPEGGLVHVAHREDTFRAIAEQGPQAIYQGDIARLIAADMAANGGLITTEDLLGVPAAGSAAARGGHQRLAYRDQPGSGHRWDHANGSAHAHERLPEGPVDTSRLRPSDPRSDSRARIPT